MSAHPISVVRPHGRLDALGARGLLSELEPLTQGPNHVLVDLGDARYISSDGLRVLVRAHRALEEKGGQLALCCLSPRLIEIVTMAGLDRILDIHPTAGAARRALGELAP